MGLGSLFLLPMAQTASARKARHFTRKHLRPVNPDFPAEEQKSPRQRAFRLHRPAFQF
jgi:hypothetical protein